MVRRQSRLRAIDLIVALATSALAFAVYLRTLYPGMGGGGDAAKFQFVGRVLGTPHPPGYPLYVLISYLFAHLPFGSLAWRINMMSAFFAAVAVALSVLILVRLGCRRTVAAAVGLALAFDSVLWSNAVHAEVYALAGALVAAIAFCALRWEATGRDRDLYLTVAMFALSLGNHLTVTTLLPGLMGYLILTRPQVIRLRTAVIATLIVLAGLAQYGFIILRTRQGAPFLEAQATNLRELIGVMHATRFSYQVFAFSPVQLLTERVPALWQISLAELNVVGVLLVAAGLAALILRRDRAGVLLGAGAAGIFFLTLNVDADVEGFLVGAFVLIWIVAGVGLDAVVRRIPSARFAGVALAATLLLPVWQLTRNYRANDHHRRTYETQYFRALFDQLDERTVIVSESYVVDSQLLYKLLGEGAAGRRTIQPVPVDAAIIRQRVASGFAVYAFTEGKRALEAGGFQFEPVSLTLTDRAGTTPATPIDMAPLPFFRLVRAAECRDVGNNGWQDVTALAPDGRLLLRIDDYEPFNAQAIIYAGEPGRPTGTPLLAASQGMGSPVMSVGAFSMGEAALQSALDGDDVPRDRLSTAAFVHRLAIRVNDEGQFAWSAIDLRGRPTAVLIRTTVDRDNPHRATVCGWSGRDLFEHTSVEHIPFGADQNVWFGKGWYDPEVGREGRSFRWTGEHQAELLVPLAATGPVIVRVTAAPFDYPGAPARSIALNVNGTTLVSQPLSRDTRAYEWTVPATTWSPGFNRVALVSSALMSPKAAGLSQDPRRLGIAVTDVSFELLGQVGAPADHERVGVF